MARLTNVKNLLVTRPDLFDELLQFLLKDEDDGPLELRPYWDTKGYLTIGPGINLGVHCDDPWVLNDLIKLPKADIFTREEVLYLYGNRVRGAAEEFAKHYGYVFLDREFSINRYFVLVGMMYNLGLTRFRKFKDMITALEIAAVQDTQEAWSKVAAEILDSAAARDLPKRYNRYAAMMKEG